MISLPSRGDIVMVDFKGAVGREQMGARPALVLTSSDYHTISATAVVIPITNNLNPWPFKVTIPENDLVNGTILIDQIKSVDRFHRGFRKLHELDNETMSEVENMLVEFLGLNENL